MRAVAANADADRSRRATLSLRLPHRVENALADTLEIAVGAAQVLQLTRQRVLDVLVLAAATLQDQLHVDVILVPLLEVDDRSLDAEIVAAVPSGNGIDRVGSKLATAGRFGHSVDDGALDGELISAH